MNTNDNCDNKNKNVLPLNDFLAINDDYIAYKKSWDKKNNKDMAFGVLGYFLIIGIAVYIGCVTWNMILMMILLALFTILFAWYMASKESKNKRELEEYGANLYKEYLKTINT